MARRPQAGLSYWRVRCHLSRPFSSGRPAVSSGGGLRDDGGGKGATSEGKVRNEANFRSFVNDWFGLDCG